MKKILISTVVISSIVITAVGATRAFFSDTETSTNNIFQAGKIDLSLNGQNGTAVALVNIEDLKPGDPIDIPKTLFVDSNDAWVWMHIKDIQTGQGEQTEPEEKEENDTPKHDINNYLTYGLTGVEGQNIIDPDNQIDFETAVSCWIPLGQITGGADVDIHQHFYFDSAVTNWAQGDTMSFTEEFYAEQARNNSNPAGPESLTGRVWNPQTGMCEDEMQLLETLFVGATTANQTLSSTVTQVGKQYLLEVNGKYIYWPTCGITPDLYDPDYPGGECIADAEFSLRPSASFGPGWIKGEDVFTPSDALDLRVNGASVDWAASVDLPDHVYSTNLSGNGSQISFSFYDSFYPDNQGGLTVKIYELP